MFARQLCVYRGRCYSSTYTNVWLFDYKLSRNTASSILVNEQIEATVHLHSFVTVQYVIWYLLSSHLERVLDSFRACRGSTSTMRKWKTLRPPHRWLLSNLSSKLTRKRHQDPWRYFLYMSVWEKKTRNSLGAWEQFSSSDTFFPRSDIPKVGCQKQIKWVYWL